jgi:predicted nucleic acid-binding protein
MILVDSSSWIHFLRKDGDAVVQSRVKRALNDGEACWCSMVKLELWNGAAGTRDHKVLKEFDEVLPLLSIDELVWTMASDLAKRARSKGISVPSTDLLIAACARHHGVDIETADNDFELIASVY